MNMNTTNTTVVLAIIIFEYEFSVFIIDILSPSLSPQYVAVSWPLEATS